MKAVRLYSESHELRVESLPMPGSPGPGEVLIKTLYCGVCGSDYHRLYGKDARLSPLAIGHEFSAKVIETGEGVESVRPGDLVAVIPLIVCGKCRNCLSGNFGQCDDSTFIGGRFPDKGGFVEYNIIGEKNLLKLPEGIDPMHASFLEPLSVALHGLLIAGVKPGIELAIMGVGTIGMLALQCAKALGVSEIYAFDIDQGRLNLAKELGAYATYNTSEPGFEERFLKDTGGRGARQVVEACGEEQTILASLAIGAVEANIALIGSMTANVQIPPELFYRVVSYRQMHIHGVWMSYSQDFPGVEWRLGIQLLKDGKLELNPLIYSLGDIDNAQKLMSHYLENNRIKGKVVLKMTSE